MDKDNVLMVTNLTASSVGRLQEFSIIKNKKKAFFSTEKELNSLLTNVLAINSDYNRIFKIAGGYLLPVGEDKWLKIMGSVLEIYSFMYYENDKAVNCLLDKHKNSITFSKVDSCFLDSSMVLTKMYA